MTQPDLALVQLTRPERAPDAGPLDDHFYDLVEARFRRIVRDNPGVATFLGIHSEDHRLGDGSRDAVEQEIVDERAHLATIEALDPEGFSPSALLERELEIHNVRRVIFDLDRHRVWERRSTAIDAIGDPLFALFVRDFAPLPERLDAIASRMEAIPACLDQHRSRAAVPQVRLWQALELESAHSVPGLFDELVAAGRGVIGKAEQRRLALAASVATRAVGEYAE